MISYPEGGGDALQVNTGEKVLFRPFVVGEYVVQLIVNDGFSDSEPHRITIFAIDATSASNTPTMPQFSIYPNPTSDTITILFDSIDGCERTLEIIDTQQRVRVSRMIGNSNTITLNLKGYNLPDGLYVVRVISKSGLSVRMLVLRNG